MKFIKLFKTQEGDVPADYESLVNLPTVNGEKFKGDVTEMITAAVLANMINASEVAM